MVNKFIEYTYGELLIGNFLGTITFPGDVSIGGDLTVTGSANIGVDETITGELFLADGTAAAPSLSFASDIDSGLYLDNAGIIGISIGGSRRFTFESSAIYGGYGTGGIAIGTGVSSPTVPKYGFYDDGNTGYGWGGNDILSLTTNGIEGLRIDGNELEVQPLMTLATGNIELEEDSGAVTLINLPVSSTPSDGDEESYTFSIDSNPVLKIKGSADGTGGIYGKSVKIEGGLVLNDVNTFVDEDTTPNVSGATYFNTNTTTVIITDFDWAGKTIPAGQMLYVVSKGAITFNVTTSGIKGGTTDIVTAAGDLTTFLYDGTDWIVISRMDMSDDLN